MNSTFKESRDSYASGINALKVEIASLVEPRRRELDALAHADDEMRATYEAERARRAEEDRARLEAEAAAAKAATEAEARAQAAAGQVQAAVDAAVMAGGAADVKEGYRIEIGDKSANILVAQFWFINEGKNLSQDKIDRMTFERMRKFCEAYAVRTGEMIDSPTLEYLPVYKAR
jgi:regulator of protease activity HflC (stomatin/prohibitin superfamily)